MRLILFLMVDQLFQRFETSFQLCYLRFLLFQFLIQLLVQTLDRSQRHAAFVHGGNVFLVFANTERSIKVLSHGSEMADGPILRFVVP